MSIREATIQDAGRFMLLWEAMLEEVFTNFPKADSGPTRKNLNYHKLIFDNYVEGFAKGLVLLWTPSQVVAASLQERPVLTPPVSTPAASLPEGERSVTPFEGLLMVGEKLGSADSLDERWEQPAWIHGVYVGPAYRALGAWRALHRAAKKPLMKMGFTDALGFVPAGHSESFRMNTLSGGEAYAILMEMKLEG